MSLFVGRLKLKVSIIMLLIFSIFWSIAAPTLWKSYKNYQESQLSNQRLQLLHELAELCLLLSKERGRAIIAMSDFKDNNSSKTDLTTLRQRVDIQFQDLLIILEQQGHLELHQRLKNELHPILFNARTAVDQYINLELNHVNKTKKRMDQVIVKMFDAWDEAQMILQQFSYNYQGYDQHSADLFNLTMVLVEFRDQLGRLGANIAAPLMFNYKVLPEMSEDRLRRNRKNLKFLWLMLEEMDQQYRTDRQYVSLKLEVEKLYQQKKAPYVENLFKDNIGDNKYASDNHEKISNFLNNLIHISNLQEYIARLSQENMYATSKIAEQKFQLTLFLTTLASLIFLLMLYILNRKIFAPLLLVRDSLLNVLQMKKGFGLDKDLKNVDEIKTLFHIIRKIKEMIENRDALEEQLTFLANTDGLTGLYNRTALNKKIEILENNAEKLNNYALLVIDIDNFKVINDKYGHLIGDQAIINISKYMREVTQSEDFAVRYGGDELIILLKQNKQEVVLNIAYNLREKIEHNPLQTQEFNIPLSVSVGVAIGAENWTQLMHNADLALLKAKQLGKNNVQHYVAQQA